MAVTHFNGSATTDPATVNFNRTIRSIMIQHVGSGNLLLVSFDGGTLFKTLKRREALSIDAPIESMVVQSDTGSVDYEAVVV